MIKSDGGLARLFQRAWDRLRLNVYIYPGIVGYRSADFLADYYAWRRSRLTSLQIVFNAIVWCGFQAWLPHRARTVARAWGKDEAWVRFARSLGGERMIDPEDLATFGINNELQARTYMRRMDQVQVFRTIESRETDHVTDLIDKELFQSKCEAGGFPIPAIVAIVENGNLERIAARPVPESIIAKPVRGSGGKGITALEHADENRLAEFAASLIHGRYIVQERLRSHPELTDIALDALCTVRMITLRNEEGRPELVHATMRFAARKEAFVDNGHAGGLVGPLDIESGKISAGISGWGPGTHRTHPATGALIDGRYLPDWSEAKALAVDAHTKLFPVQTLIGWDIGISAQGPVVIEANQRPAVRLTQRSAGCGIGSMRYGELLRHHLRLAAMSDGGRHRHLHQG